MEDLISLGLHKEIVFISGPITGMPDLNIPAFNAAEAKIKRTGAKVYNPASLPLEKEWEWYMDQCLEAIHGCTAIYQLLGWENSRGARIENEWALESGLRFVTDAEIEKCLGAEMIPDAIKKQPMSSGDGEYVLPAVIEDLKSRDVVGIKKYGTSLRTNNGRSAMVDLYQELLDAVMYIKQKMMEDEGSKNE